MKHLLRKVFCGLLIFATLLSFAQFSVEAAPGAPVWPEAPEIAAEGAVLIEASTGTIIYNKNAYERFYPASTTKLMTALLALEQSSLSEIVTCSYKSVHSFGWDSSRIGLVEKEQINMEEALYAILLASANEVSYAVAEHIGGTMDNFVALMNERAKELGCVNTNFVNSHGLHEEEHYSCPYDLALIAKKAIEYTTFCRISNSSYHIIPETNLNVSRTIPNTHQILRKKISYEGVFAGKTGHTSIAGNCLVTCAKRNGMTLIAVVMKSPDSTTVYNDTIALLDYGFHNFELSEVSFQSDTTNAFPFLFEDEDVLVSEVNSPLTTGVSNVVLPIGASYENLTKETALLPVTALSAGNNIIGKVSYFYADNYIGSADLFYYSEEAVTVKTQPTPSPTPSATPTPLPTEASSPEPTDTPAETPTEVPTETPAETPVPGASSDDSSQTSKEPPKNTRPLIIAIIAGAVVLIFALYIIFIELPYRKRRKEYYRRRRRRY